MPVKTCQNPDCNTAYNSDGKHDDGFCSDECWSKVNCKEPVEPVEPVEQFEEMVIT